MYVSGFTIPDRDLVLTTTGDISVSDVTLGKGILEINTETGDIYLYDIDLGNRDLSLSTKGDIAVYDTKATIQLTSISGDIGVMNTSFISSLKTDKGSIFAQIISLKQDMQISTGRGSIKLEINPELDADLTVDVHALIGGIFLTNLRSILSIDSSSFKHVDASIGFGDNVIQVSIGDEQNPSALIGGFITLKKYRAPLFPFFF